MFEKVNPCHPDKLADRIAGALVDMAYKKTLNPKIAVEVLLGHGRCHIIVESSVSIDVFDVLDAVGRIAGQLKVDYHPVSQDSILAENQSSEMRCGDNGIFKGAPVTSEQLEMTRIAKDLFKRFPTDGKYILDGDRLIICQSHASQSEIKALYPKAVINPLGYWTGGLDVDSGATNRKLGSDMADSVTGGGLHGKDLSKADVSVNIYAWLKAQATGKPVELSCAIGDREIDGMPYSQVVDIARSFIEKIGGFEKFAEWGLVR